MVGWARWKDRDFHAVLIDDIHSFKSCSHLLDRTELKWLLCRVHFCYSNVNAPWDYRSRSTALFDGHLSLQYLVYLLWPPYRIGQAIIFSSCGFFMTALRSRRRHYIFALWFLLLSSSFFFFPRPISAVADWMTVHYLGHSVSTKKTPSRAHTCMQYWYDVIWCMWRVRGTALGLHTYGCRSIYT